MKFKAGDKIRIKRALCSGPACSFIFIVASVTEIKSGTYISANRDWSKTEIALTPDFYSWAFYSNEIEIMEEV